MNKPWSKIQMFGITISYIILRIMSDTFSLMFYETYTKPPDVWWKDMAVYEGTFSEEDLASYWMIQTQCNWHHQIQKSVSIAIVSSPCICLHVAVCTWVCLFNVMTAETIMCIFVLLIFFKIYTFTHLAILRDTTLHVFQDLEVFIICIFQLCKVLTNKCN